MTAAEERENEKIMKGLARLLGGKPTNVIAPVLVVTVARTLFLEAANDPDKLGFLLFKFVHHLQKTISEMAADEGLGEPRQ